MGNPSVSSAPRRTYGPSVRGVDGTEQPEILRLACEAMSAVDLDTLVRRVFTPRVRWHEPGRNLISGDYVGSEEVLLLVARRANLTGGTFRLDLRYRMAQGATAVGLTTATAARLGRSLASPDLWVVTVRNGRIDEAWSYHQDQHGWDRFWS